LANLLFTTEDLVNSITCHITQNKHHHPNIALRYSETSDSIKTKSFNDIATVTPPTPYRLSWIKTSDKPIGKFKHQSFYDAALHDRVLAVQIMRKLKMIEN
jgi:hypothetical protein